MHNFLHKIIYFFLLSILVLCVVVIILNPKHLFASCDAYVETFVRADGAFIPFADDFDLSAITTHVKGVGEIGDVKVIDLQSPISSVIGCQVSKVGRSSGLTAGTIMAYALEYNDEKSICFFTDLLVVGENQQTFDLEGDSGSLIILTGQNGELPRPIGIIWGGTANRGRLKLKGDHGPENWTSGVDLGRLLDRLELNIVTTNEGFRAAVEEQKSLLAVAANSIIGESSPVGPGMPEERVGEIYEPLDINIEQLPPNHEPEFRVETVETNNNKAVEEHQFISNFLSPVRVSEEAAANLEANNNLSDEDLSVSLHLGDREPKRQRRDSKVDIDLDK
ncbi:narrow leaf 1 [Carex littledalei]|uniref:Narrow leaf 1 n=1 Tax=Carex littledalei TaxID=544730 RepID=A0A833QIB4_9POAL|nr:narrow leaf 1 [Carex littledalei]